MLVQISPSPAGAAATPHPTRDARAGGGLPLGADALTAAAAVPAPALAGAGAFEHPPAGVVGAARVRPARITDMQAVARLIRVYAAQNLMLPRSPEQLARNFREFVVAVDEADRVIGCGALRIFTEELAEVASLAVERGAQGRGIGRLVVERLLGEAAELKVRTVFALTLEPAFFARLGFRVVPKSDFPLKVWADCRVCPKLHACDEIAVALEIAPALP